MVSVQAAMTPQQIGRGVPTGTEPITTTQAALFVASGRKDEFRCERELSLSLQPHLNVQDGDCGGMKLITISSGCC